MTRGDRPAAIVVGAGVLGAATAERLARSGWRVTLVEARSPAHARSASGSSSRLMRLSHGADRTDAESAWTPRRLWHELEALAGVKLLAETGLAMFAPATDPFVPASAATFEELGVPYCELDGNEAGKLFPSLAVGEDELVVLEEAAGVVHAGRAVRTLVDRTLALGGTLVKGRARPAGRGVEVGGRRIGADAVVWACGAWTARLFPELVEVDVIEQDLFYFGAPPGWRCPPVPAFMDRAAGYSGCGDFARRGVKVGGDLLGPVLDPDRPRAGHDEAQESAARGYVARRFPALGGSPVVAREICHSALVRRRALEVVETRGEVPIARHPDDPAVVLVGDGSGHGFKHAPVIATLVERLLSGPSGPDSAHPGRVLADAETFRGARDDENRR